MQVFILLSLRVVMLRTALVALLPLVSSMCFAETQAVDIYSQDQLLDLIRSNQYLAKVKRDDCQLVQDIEARAQVLKQPLYQFLWGEMLNHGTCVKANPVKGIALLRDSAEQGSSEAMLKLAEYYQSGKFVIRNKDRAVHYLLPAAASGSLSARMMLVRLFGEGYGSPRDYEMAYHWLYNDVFADEATKNKALSLLQVLAAKMPPSAVARAQQEQLRTR
ncbi:flagellar protein MotX [Shewanella sp. NKUCC05_KAH]|uniref:Flagellar protein MotX n=2 Tax=Shewanella TaxID=22 RepID=A0AA50KE46_9GAMM|nr:MULTISPECIES: flagellar protein MotX [Shewanella]MBI1676545.1 sel1 repeat family protein [Shewanella sp. DW31]MBP6519807.1 sel1 repeat family protein [Shewanella sp.]MBP8118981.1 sel1 repeat family protein [Shewanella sp.]MBW3516818.1 flagellar protein MotX [Shewanella sp. NKUCC01_JLK]MBW3529015.1 flagellar protein MotX [Shewanella sp. NKUCC05_KAH]